MKLFDLDLEKRKLFIDFVENLIMFNIRTEMLDKNRKLTSDEIEQIVHKELNYLKEQI